MISLISRKRKLHTALVNAKAIPDMWLLCVLLFVPEIFSFKVYKDIVHGETFVEDWEPHKNISEHIVEFAAEMAPYYFAANYDDYGEFRTEKVRDTRYEIDKVVKHHWREVTYRSIDDVKQKFHYDIIPYAKNYHLAHGHPLPENFEDEMMNFLEDLRFKYIRMFISRNATRHDQVYIPIFVEMTIIRARLTPRVLLIKDFYDIVEDDSAPVPETAALDERKNAQMKIDKMGLDLGKVVLPADAMATTTTPVTTTVLETTAVTEAETPKVTEAPVPETTEEAATEAVTEAATEQPQVEEVAAPTETSIVEEVTTEAPVEETTTVEEPTVEETTEEPVTEATEAVTEPVTETVTEEPVEAVTEEVTEEPITEETVTEETVTEEPTEAPETENVGEEETATEEPATEEEPVTETVTEEIPTEPPTDSEPLGDDSSVDTVVDGGHGDGGNDEAEEEATSDDFAAESPPHSDTTYLTPVEPGPIILLDE
ncbi:unnamed protein product, partial [Mesorhabditis belari]|uniref:Zonadhesin n=1 Tax=Mesorhabditis belari TaxID=2138241 RepID=A0AAF3FI23_9BILA